MKTLAKLLLLLLLAAGGTAGYLWYAMAKPYGSYPPEGVFVDIARGASQRSVARRLEKDGIIRSAVAFEIYSRRHPKRTLQAGEYFFGHPVSGRDVFWTIASGNVYQRPFTVREGETMFDIARELEAGKFMAADDFLAAAKNPQPIQDLAPQARTLEGFLFPATYQLPRHPVAAELVAQMTQKFREEWSEIARTDPNFDSHGHPLISTVTLASLVERETPKPEERFLVAGVFENRLKKGMLLQCDPTVIYALEQEGRYNGTLTGKDLHVESPYNTYMHGGLPPGPIGNPGIISLRAALAPADTPFLYFVANTQGGHFFSSTLAEHNDNVIRYHRLLAGQPADPPPAETQASSKSQGKKHKGSGR